MLINIENAEKEFLKYTKCFNQEDDKVIRKTSHSLRVKEISRKIAEAELESDEKKDLAELIGLLHDIGRFEQVKRTNCFKDSVLDHANVGIEVLCNNSFIRNFICDERYDSVMLKAIGNHNKFKIEDGLTEDELKQAKIIRDADKLDILYLYSEMEDLSYLVDGKNPSDDKISQKVLDAFFEAKQVNKDELESFLDHYINTISFIFDINEKYSFKYLKEKNYMNIIIDKIEEITPSITNIFEKIRDFTNNYLEIKSK